jgi:hypothetical protein
LAASGEWIISPSAGKRRKAAMKATNLRIRMTLQDPGEPDDLNRTEVILDGQLYWPRYEWAGGSRIIDYVAVSPAEDIEVGTNIELSIPSGRLRGRVSRKWQNFAGDWIVEIKAAWEGRAGGLAGSLSGFGEFHIINDYEPRGPRCGEPAQVTQTSAWDKNLNYYVYERVRSLADLAASERPKAEVMRRIFEALDF